MLKCKQHHQKVVLQVTGFHILDLPRGNSPRERIKQSSGDGCLSLLQSCRYRAQAALILSSTTSSGPLMPKTLR